MFSISRRVTVSAAIAVLASVAAPVPSAGAATGSTTPVVVDTARGAGQVVSFTFDDGPNPPAR